MKRVIFFIIFFFIVVVFVFIIIFSIFMLLLSRWDANRVIDKLNREDEVEFLKKVRDEMMKKKQDVPEQK